MQRAVRTTQEQQFGPMNAGESFQCGSFRTSGAPHKPELDLKLSVSPTDAQLDEFSSPVRGWKENENELLG